MKRLRMLLALVLLILVLSPVIVLASGSGMQSRDSNAVVRDDMTSQEQ